MITSRAGLVACAIAAVAIVTTSGVARADQGWKEDRGFFEWSTWVRLGFAVKREEEPALAVPRTVTPQPASYDQAAGFETALGADFMLPIPTKFVRLGPWAEVRGLHEIVSGLELQIARSPRDLDMFFYDGEGMWSIRAGASSSNLTASVAWGYRCPWVMFSDAPKGARYMIGGRIVASVTRAVDNPNVWSGSLGIEFEPVGTLRYLLGIRSWY